MVSDQKQNVSKIREHYEAVLNSTGATHSQSRVLHLMIWNANFYENFGRISKDGIVRRTGLGITTVKKALKFLREEGSIKPIRHAGGGHGMATTYSFHVVGQGTKEPVEVQSGEGTVWADIYTTCLIKSPDKTRAWLKQLEFVSFENDELKLLAPTRFHAEQVKNNLSDKLLSIAASLDITIKHLTILEP